MPETNAQGGRMLLDRVAYRVVQLPNECDNDE
jgi:hypothetical protein